MRADRRIGFSQRIGGAAADLHPGKRPPAGLPGPQPWSVGYCCRGEAAYGVRELVPAFPPCHCRLGSALSHGVPCSFPLRRTIPRTPLSCHCRLGSAPSYAAPCSFPFTPNHSAHTSPVPLPSRQCPSYDVPCSFPLRRTIPRTSLGATAVSAVLLLTPHLARSLYAEPFREHLSRATVVSAVPLLMTYLARSLHAKPFRETPLSCHCRLGSALLTTYLARSLYAEPFHEHLPVPLRSANTSLVPLPSRQCSFSRRTLFVPFTLNHSAHSRLPRRNRPAKPPMECGNLFPLSGLQPPANTPVRAFPISQLRSAISDTLCPRARNRTRLCISLCSLCFLLFILFFVFMLASIVTQFRRGEPRNTRNTRKWPTTAILPACRWKLYDVCPSAHGPGVFPLHAAAKPHMECGNLLPLFGLQPPANTPVRRVPDLPTPICDLRHLASSCSKS